VHTYFILSHFHSNEFSVTFIPLSPESLASSPQPATTAAFKFTPKPTNKNFELGSSGKINCKANGSVKVYWTKEGEETEKLPDDVDDVNGTLIFNNIASAQRGIYTCIASNGVETIQHQIEVGILPQFEIPPQEYLEVVEMQSVIIDCVGSDNSTMRWDFETTIIQSENDERFHIYENGSLLLHEARQDDSGRYGCTIGNSAGFKRSETHVVIKRKYATSLL
jgi:PTK7 protein tyrosine kinase 7